MKNRLRRIIIAALAVFSVCVMCACAGNTADDKSKAGQTGITDGEVPAKEDNGKAAQTADAKISEGSGSSDVSPEEAGGVPLVAVVTSAGGIEDESFNQGAWEGLQRLEGSMECNTRFLENTSDDKEFAQNIAGLVDEGVTLCWGLGYDCSDMLLDAADKYPDTSFAIIDYTYDDIPMNMTCVEFRTGEASFLAGYIAGAVTVTGKVGFVGGEDNAVIDRFRYGYETGAAYAADELNKEVEVSVAYAGTYTDEDKGKELAKAMYDDGCDVIFHAAGQTGIGVIRAAEDVGEYVIGVDKDQSYLAPDNVLTSVLKNVNIAIPTVSKSYLEGDVIGGRTISMGMTEDAVGLSEDHHLYSDEIYSRVNELKDMIIAGDIEIPSSGID